MDRLVYTALSGMQASMNKQRVIANNMANAQTLGFRAEMLDQRPVTVTGDGLEVRALQKGLVRGADMRAGTQIETGNTLDIAVNGTAFIAVQTADGNEAYTRRGDLSLTDQGLLINGEGLAVLGDTGPITVPVGMETSIAPDGTVMIADPAIPGQPPQEVGRIKLASIEGSSVRKTLDGLFRVEGGGVLPTDETARVTAGALEQSNVKTTEVLVEMIDAQRLFALRSKLISTASEVDESGAQLMRLG